MAPVAGRVSYTQEYWGVASTCLLEGFFAPRAPVNRVVCVLLKVGAFLVDEVVGSLVRRLVFPCLVGVSLLLADLQELKDHTRALFPLVHANLF